MSISGSIERITYALGYMKDLHVRLVKRRQSVREFRLSLASVVCKHQQSATRQTYDGTRFAIPESAVNHEILA
jgi:hypothetical protein